MTCFKKGSGDDFKFGLTAFMGHQRTIINQKIPYPNKFQLNFFEPRHNQWNFWIFFNTFDFNLNFFELILNSYEFILKWQLRSLFGLKISHFFRIKWVFFSSKLCCDKKLETFLIWKSRDHYFIAISSKFFPRMPNSWDSTGSIQTPLHSSRL